MSQPRGSFYTDHAVSVLHYYESSVSSSHEDVRYLQRAALPYHTSITFVGDLADLFLDGECKPFTVIRFDLDLRDEFDESVELTAIGKVLGQTYPLSLIYLRSIAVYDTMDGRRIASLRHYVESAL